MSRWKVFIEKGDIRSAFFTMADSMEEAIENATKFNEGWEVIQLNEQGNVRPHVQLLG